MRRAAAVLLLLSTLLLDSACPAPARAATEGDPSPLAFRRRTPLALTLAKRAPVSLRDDPAVEVGAAVAVSGLGFLLDDTIEPGSGENTFYDNAGDALGNFFVLAGATGAFALHAWATDNDENLEASKDAAIALGATTGTVGILKATVSRERPDASDDHSFPSGHAANSFAVATVLERHYGGTVGWIAYGTAAFIASSRVIGNHHWLSDVMTGASIGFLWGRLVTSGE